MTWRATLSSLLWFTLLGPLSMLVLGAIGVATDVLSLGPSLEHDGLMVLALPYAYLMFGLPSFLTGLLFSALRSLHAPWLAGRAGALIAGALAGALVGMVTSVAFMLLMKFASPIAVIPGALLGVIVGAPCGLFTHMRTKHAPVRNPIDA